MHVDHLLEQERIASSNKEKVTVPKGVRVGGSICCVILKFGPVECDGFLANSKGNTLSINIYKDDLFFKKPSPRIKREWGSGSKSIQLRSQLEIGTFHTLTDFRRARIFPDRIRLRFNARTKIRPIAVHVVIPVIAWNHEIGQGSPSFFGTGVTTEQHWAQDLDQEYEFEQQEVVVFGASVISRAASCPLSLSVMNYGFWSLDGAPLRVLTLVLHVFSTLHSLAVDHIFQNLLLDTQGV
ncbi:hypothetical protein Tco_0655565 [Tanacetum coccineum]|uniref:Galectin n=1 Tax=Tanacetum coccineum TaxID=301880 RepID=A0ABQ4X7I3_9ASTR